MPSASLPRGRAVTRAVLVAVVTALAAVAVGALHGGAATPQTQSIAVPSKAGRP
jgi:hypothetical protein